MTHPPILLPLADRLLHARNNIGALSAADIATLRDMSPDELHELTSALVLVANSSTEAAHLLTQLQDTGII